jgi:hypothetical protein
MLRWTCLGVIVVAMVGAATFMSLNATVVGVGPTAIPAPPPAEGPVPKVEVPEPLTYEFGFMPQQSTGTHAWEFKNLGESDLELWFESSTCSCTVAKLKSGDGVEKKTLVVKPHDSTMIDLEWQTKTFHDEYTKGAVIGTNDPARPSVSINVHGKVHPPVIIYPPEMMNFGSVSNEEPHSANFAVFSMDRPQIKILKITTSRPEFLLHKLKPLTPEDCKQLKVTAGYMVTVELKTGMPLGRFHEELAIETDHPLQAEVKMSVGGSVTGSITMVPERIRMPNVSGANGAAADMTILVRGGKPTKFAVFYHPEKLNVKITPDDTPSQKGRYKMTVSVPPGTAGGPVEGEIILKTDHPQAALVKIPVSVLISNSISG